MKIVKKVKKIYLSKNEEVQILPSNKNGKSLLVYSNGNKLFVNFDNYANEDNLISYVDLINLIKEDRQPIKIRFYNCGYSTIYYFSYDDGSYIIKDRKKESQRFTYYLNENLTDTQYFDKKIKII